MVKRRVVETLEILKANGNSDEKIIIFNCRLRSTIICLSKNRRYRLEFFVKKIHL